MGPICQRFEDNGEKAVNCLIDENSPEEHRLPQRLANNATGIEKLKEFCGDTLEMYSDEKTPTEGYLLCCRNDQVEALAGQITMAQGIVSRCPSCWKNFRQVFCELACSPYQNYFMISVKNESSPEEVGLGDPSKPEAEFLIRELNIVFSKRYAQRTYESCKDIVMGSANSPAMDFLCGGYASLRCSPENWFEYLGDYSNGYAPFHIYFTYPEDSPDVPWLTGLDVPTYRCNESYVGLKNQLEGFS